MYLFGCPLRLDPQQDLVPSPRRGLRATRKPGLVSIRGRDASRQLTKVARRSGGDRRRSMGRRVDRRRPFHLAWRGRCGRGALLFRDPARDLVRPGFAGAEPRPTRGRSVGVRHVPERAGRTPARLGHRVVGRPGVDGRRADRGQGVGAIRRGDRMVGPRDRPSRWGEGPDAPAGAPLHRSVEPRHRVARSGRAVARIQLARRRASVGASRAGRRRASAGWAQLGGYPPRGGSAKQKGLRRWSR